MLAHDRVQQGTARPSVSTIWRMQEANGMDGESCRDSTPGKEDTALTGLHL